MINKDATVKVSDHDSSIEIHYYPVQRFGDGGAGWHLEKNGVADTPLALVSNPEIRAKIMAEANALVWPPKPQPTPKVKQPTKYIYERVFQMEIDGEWSDVLFCDCNSEGFINDRNARKEFNEDKKAHRENQPAAYRTITRRTLRSEVEEPKRKLEERKAEIAKAREIRNAAKAKLMA